MEQIYSPSGIRLKMLTSKTITQQSDTTLKKVLMHRGLETAVIVGGYAGGSNVFGHVAIAFTGRGIYSYGTNTPLGSSLITYLENQARYRSSTVFLIPSNDEQINKMVNYLNAMAKPLPDVINNPQKSFDTCAARTNGALHVAGFDDPRSSPISIMFYPNVVSNMPMDSYATARVYAREIIKIPQGGAIPSLRLQAFK